MADVRSVLVVGHGSESLHELASRLRHLGVETHLCETPDRGRTVFESEAERIAVVFVAATPPGSELGAFLAFLGTQDLTEPPGVVAVGPIPDEGGRQILREAGIERALWEPYDDGTLRFIVNEEMVTPEELRARGDARVPTTLFARIRVGGREKDALVYNLSVSGAYLETPRPSMRGARLAIDIPLPEEMLSLTGIVVYTNVPGNLQRPMLPLGMGVRFVDLDAEEEDLLQRYVEERARRYQV